jgi:thiol-disulfide isomerase/thioredoxin
LRFSALGSSFLLLSSTWTFAQQSPQKFTDPVVLLKQVAKTYAAETGTFHMEAIEETVRRNEYLNERRIVYRTAIKGSGRQYRIETKSGWGSYLQVSDGETEWLSNIEGNSYVKKPTPADGPTMSRMTTAGSMEIRNAWKMAAFLRSDAANYKRASFLPGEVLHIGRRHFACYVVHTSSSDSYRGDGSASHTEVTFWIDKKELVFRKKVENIHSYLIDVDHHMHIPFEEQHTTVYPVIDFHPKLDLALFRFTPPAGSQVGGFVGEPAPDVHFPEKTGSISLKSFEGKPVLIDFWATSCAPCLQAMPALSRLYANAKDRGLVLISVDQDSSAETAVHYLQQHHYGWKNYHDDSSLSRAFWLEGLPLTVLIDAKGKVAYYGFGNDPALLSAIAALGPEFSFIKSSQGQ